MTEFAAVDLGATSGRVMVAELSPERFEFRQVARFETPVRQNVVGNDSIRWDARALRKEILAGLSSAVRSAPGLISVGIDSWGVDYGIIRDSQLVDDPFHYRDNRTVDAARSVHRRIEPLDLFLRTGVQPSTINTIYQLSDDVMTGRLAAGDSVLMIPNLVEYWMTGRVRTEASIGSTTGLLRPDGTWDLPLADLLRIPRDVLSPVICAGAGAAPVTPRILTDLGAQRELTVMAVAAHDTASAVAALDLDEETAYVSCGTWGLVGVTLTSPVISEDAYSHGFTNELGADGTVLFQRNLMGLHLFRECMRSWGIPETSATLGELIAGAAMEPRHIAFDANDPRLAGPGSMPSKIVLACLAHGETPPSSPSGIVRAIINALAESYASAIREAVTLSGKTIRRVRLVGGGSQNTLLCQGLAEATGMPVLAGPAEASAIGNVIVQARALGSFADNLKALPALAASAFPATIYEPQGMR